MVFPVYMYIRFFHSHKRKLPPRPVLLNDDTQDTMADAELLALCSGRFDSHTFSVSHSRQSSDSGLQGVQELLGFRSKPAGTAGLRKLLESSSIMADGRGGGDRDGTESSFAVDSDEVLGLCSGVFPETQSQKSQVRAGRGNGLHDCSQDSESESEGGGEREGRGCGLVSWAQRQRKLTAMLGSREDDEDMPLLKKKRRRVKLGPKPTKG